MTTLKTQNILHQTLEAGSPQLKRYLHRHVRDSQDVADIYQESITRVLEQARKEQILNPIAYAIRVARNLLINRPAPTVSDENCPECPSAPLEDSIFYRQKLEVLSQVVNTMPSLRKKVFVLRRLNGESSKNVAMALGLSEEAVKKHVTRAMADLQRFLDSSEEL